MNKLLPEPGVSCYDNTQLATMIEEAGAELQKRGWVFHATIVAPKSKSQAKRVAIQQGQEEPYVHGAN